MGLAPPRVAMLETIPGFNAAIGILGGGFDTVGTGVEAAGGCCEATGGAKGFSEAGGTTVEGFDMFGGATAGFDCVAEGLMVVSDGFKAFA